MEKREEVINNTGWYACPRTLDLSADLTIYEKAVWHNFAAHLNNKTGQCFPSKETQAKEIGCGKDAVCKARNSLIEKGWLTKEKLLDERKKTFVRYQWTIQEPSSLKADDGFSRRREKPTTANEDANNKKIKQQEELNNTNVSEVNDFVATATTPTPSQEMQIFLSDKTKQEQIVSALVSKGIPDDAVRSELAKFASYWSELTRSGKKQRWETEKTFELRRRLVTWFNNAIKFAPKTADPKAVRIR